jgi:phage shock protein C
MGKKFHLSSKDKKIGGVCGGIAEYFKFDATLVRIISVLLCLMSFKVIIIIYIVCWAIMPSDDKDRLN